MTERAEDVRRLRAARPTVMEGHGPRPTGLLEPIEVPWVPEDVIAACRAAVHRLGMGAHGSLAVTSSVRGEGRTTVSLGVALAQRNEYGRSTLLLELDTARPVLGARLGVPGRPGLTDVLAGTAELQECVHWTAPGLGVLLAGTPRPEVAHLLEDFRRSDLLPRLEEAGHAVVADLPPLLPDVAAYRVAEVFTRTVLVVRAGLTSLPEMRTATASLAVPPAVILNGTASAVPRWLRRSLGG